MKIYNYPIIELCLLIPCYNNFDGLISSLKSIHYDIKKYLIIIIDDGSRNAITHTDIVEALISPLNVQIIRLEKNMGITKALNKGLEFIYLNYSTKYIARLDCGDICTIDRFYTQTKFLENNSDIHLVGSWCYFKNSQSGIAYKYITPTLDKYIKRSMNFRNVFIHPTVMWRVSAFNKLMYPEKYPYAEDYGLFYDMITKVKSAIINQFLVTCELNDGGISVSKRSVQLKSRLKVITDYGTNNFLYFFGVIKLFVLMVFPYQIVLLIKKKIYKVY